MNHVHDRDHEDSTRHRSAQEPAARRRRPWILVALAALLLLTAAVALTGQRAATTDTTQAAPPRSIESILEAVGCANPARIPPYAPEAVAAYECAGPGRTTVLFFDSIGKQQVTLERAARNGGSNRTNGGTVYAPGWVVETTNDTAYAAALDAGGTAL